MEPTSIRRRCTIGSLTRRCSKNWQGVGDQVESSLWRRHESNSKIATVLDPFFWDWLRKVIPDDLQQAQTSFGIVKKYAYKVFSTIEGHL